MYLDPQHFTVQKFMLLVRWWRFGPGWGWPTCGWAGVHFYSSVSVRWWRCGPRMRLTYLWVGGCAPTGAPPTPASSPPPSRTPTSSYLRSKDILYHCPTKWIKKFNCESRMMCSGSSYVFLRVPDPGKSSDTTGSGSGFDPNYLIIPLYFLYNSSKK